MADRTVQEKLLPSLLDRLEGGRLEGGRLEEDGRGADDGAPVPRALSTEHLRRCARRDLQWLLGATNLGTDFDAAAYPNVARSVLNYGLPPLSGRTVQTAEVADLEGRMFGRIRDFEPRIRPETLRVRLLSRGDRFDRTALTFFIEGEMWAQPMPIDLFLRAEVDPDVGAVSLTDSAGLR